LTPWLIHMLNFFGLKKIEIIAADQMALNYEKSIKNAEDKIENLFKD
ncbi:MAG: FMN-dependent NADH-azoreductase, partial [Proteobacteria bacterium]|nr:FMN-dependent NADH-azoreductase [Pseudomonadota bacterium]